MAIGMKAWMGLVAGGFVVIGACWLPPEDREEWLESRRRERVEQTPERAALIQAHAEINRINWRYQRLQWRDSISTLAQGAAEPGPGWATALPPAAPRRFLPELASAVEAQLAALEIGQPRVPVGLLFVEAGWGTHPGVPNPGYSYYRYSMEVFSSTDPEDPFCFRVEPVRTDSRSLEREWASAVWVPPEPGAAPSPLGPCALHARYGSPGAHLHDWLSRGAYALALGASGAGREDPFFWMDDRVRLPFGRSDRYFGAAHPDGEGCLAGREEACRRAVLGGLSLIGGRGAVRADSAAGEIPVATRIIEFGSWLPFGRQTFDILPDLEEEMGPERFGHFWASDEEVEEAFLEAFGTPLPQWVMKWAEKKVGPPGPRPPVPLSASMLTFLTIGAMACLALFRGRRPG